MQLSIGENITRLRKEKKLKQEDLADFLGVTKASVSKWENKQSYPDILLLPQISSYFGVTIDELIGYEPQLSKEQIERIYNELASSFSEDGAFEKTMEESKELVKKYYSCYPFLFQVAILWLNHITLTTDTSKQIEIMNKILELCEHIVENCSDMILIQNARALQAMTYLQLGQTDEVVQLMKPLIDSKNYEGNMDVILIKAYLMKHDIDKAEYYNQIILYRNLTELIGNSISYLQLYMGEYEKCKETIQRTQVVIDIYHVEELNTNLVLQFYYQCALVYCVNDMKEEAIEILTRFVERSDMFLKEGITFHGDDYFTRLEEWYRESPSGIITSTPRNEKLVLDSLVEAIQQPVFQGLKDLPQYQLLMKKFNNLTTNK